ncbi:hypothetical protein MGALJ_43080 [Mycobacterium gallinarum]|uniref:DUF1707 domain-containing protein n=1 Tax=Mycobacterium gallinarum TaxID=39689 RepID=A0A9W4B670_9MYCO|nr:MULTISPECIES: DUF1707 domain-containing protein [Mycobacterium]MDV3131386.1 DUF1707 domain-containing protein [Mycobacterium sp. 29Ha]BBY94639.1 hypothetical protein MGALJ_43080 [Mycobacterium gallinarum]
MANRQTAGTRAKDSDRNDTCQILDSALADGQLSMEEHRTRVALATQSETLGDLQSLISDLQTGNAPVQLPDLKRQSKMPSGGGGWGIRLAVAGVLVALGIGIGWGLYGNTTSPLSFTSDPGAKSDGIPGKVLTPPKQLQSLGGLNGLLEQMRQQFGDTMGYDMVIYPEYAVLYRPDPSDERRKLSYTYRGGFDDPTTSAKSEDDVLVDLGAFDVETAVGILRGAAETVGLNPADVKKDSTYLTIDPAKDPTAPGELTLRANVSSDFGSGSVTFAGDGTVKRIDDVT